MISLIGKIVRVDKGDLLDGPDIYQDKATNQIRLSNKVLFINALQLISFFYPDFLIKESLFFNQNDSVIYSCSSNRKEQIINTHDKLSKDTKQFILAVDRRASKYDYDFTKRTVILDFVYGKWNKQSKELLAPEELKYLESMPYMEFISHIKYYWMLGRSTYDFVNKKEAVRAFNNALGGNKPDTVQAYFNLLNNHLKPSYIEEFVLSWIESNYLYTNENECLRMRQITTSLAIYRNMLERHMNKKLALIWLVKSLAKDDMEIA